MMESTLETASFSYAFIDHLSTLVASEGNNAFLMKVDIIVAQNQSFNILFTYGTYYESRVLYTRHIFEWLR